MESKYLYMADKSFGVSHGLVQANSDSGKGSQRNIVSFPNPRVYKSCFPSCPSLFISVDSISVSACTSTASRPNSSSSGGYAHALPESRNLTQTLIELISPAGSPPRRKSNIFMGYETNSVEIRRP